VSGPGLLLALGQLIDHPALLLRADLIAPLFKSSSSFRVRAADCPGRFQLAASAASRSRSLRTSGFFLRRLATGSLPMNVVT